MTLSMKTSTHKIETAKLNLGFFTFMYLKPI